MILNEIKEMQSQGLQDSEIIQKLTEKGISPLEISQALEQASIKTAVQGEDMQPSMLDQESQGSSQENYMPPQMAQEAPQEQQEQYPQYQQYQQYPEYQQPNSDTISEISEQIVEEKLDQVKKELSKLGDFKNISGKRIEDLDKRLERIESVLDKIQANILNKFSEHIQDIQGIRQEMGMMQDSFSKVLVPRKNTTESKVQSPQRKSKNKESFEDLLER